MAEVKGRIDGNNVVVEFGGKVVFKGGLADCNDILSPNTTNKNKTWKEFESNCIACLPPSAILGEKKDSKKTVGDFIKAAREQILLVMPELMEPAASQGEVESPLENPPSSWEELQAEVEKSYPGMGPMLFNITCALLSNYYRQEESIYVALIGDRGTGKSTLKQIVHRSCVTVDDCTLQSLAPGTPQRDVENFGLLDECNGDTLFVHDGSALLSGKDENVEHFFKTMENAFGKDGFEKHSPGSGIRKFGGSGFNFIIGTPHDLFRNNFKRFVQCNRFLFLQMPEIDQVAIIRNRSKLARPVDLDRKFEAWFNSVKGDLPEIRVPQEVADYLADFFEGYLHYKRFYTDQGYTRPSYHDYRNEGVIRTSEQVIMLAKAMARISGRNAVEVEDIDHWLQYLTPDTPDYIMTKLTDTLLMEHLKSPELLAAQLIGGRM